MQAAKKETFGGLLMDLDFPGEGGVSQTTHLRYEARPRRGPLRDCVSDRGCHRPKNRIR